MPPLQRPHFCYYSTYIEALYIRIDKQQEFISNLYVPFFLMQAIKKCINFSFEGESNYTQAVKLQMMKRCTPSE